MDVQNQQGAKHWESSWDTRGVQAFSVHSTFIEETKWSYLLEDLKERQGTSLEVGCGSGHFSALMASVGFNALLLDYTPSALECARNSFIELQGKERKKYLLGNALALPLADNTVDVVISCGVLEHFEHPEFPIREMCRVLRKGSLFFADIVPKKFGLIRLLDFLFKPPPGFYENKIGKNQIRCLIEGAGLEIVRLFGAGVLPPRNVPLKGKLRLDVLDKFLITRFRKFWQLFDNTMLGDWLGIYYYITARKK